ncbi:uncharacterized protein [Montipora foliosa]|uniref:uncharacterized protein n=1 Tax=Montipora foliosa TaxID=591990 RepID=UPI0035F11C32
MADLLKQNAYGNSEKKLPRKLQLVIAMFTKSKVKDRSVLDWKTTEVVKQLTRMIATGAFTPHKIGEIVMEDAHLRDAVKAVLLSDVDDQCKQLCKKSDESAVLRLQHFKDILPKMYLDAWTSGKISCPHIDCSLNNVLLFPDGLKNHYRAQHSPASCGDEEQQQGKNCTRKLLAAETLNNLTILSQKRKEQDYAQLYQTFTIECNGECFDVVAIHEKEAAKLFGLYLWHKGDLHWLEEGSKPVLVKVLNTMVSSIFNLWRSKQKIYAEVTFYKKFHTYVLPTPAPQAQPIHASIMQEIPNALTEEDEPLYVLKTIFGYESFREGQLEAIQAIVGGKDCVILMPTGGGKSLIFAVAAIVKQGLTVVIEPLKFLMEEQVAILREKGVSAFYFNSSLTDTEMDFVIHSLTRFRSQYVMLFTSPECIFSERLKKVLSSWNAIGKLGLIAVDEGNKNQRYNKLNESTYFFYNSTECRLVQILSYFGEGASNPCETTCDVCTNGPLKDHGIQSDKTELAKIVTHCVIEMQIVGKVNVTLLSQVLMGSVSAEILTSGLDKLNGYCKAKELLPGRNGRKLLVKFIYYLILKGFLKETISGASNCNVALTVGDVSNLLSGSVKIY